MTAYPQAMNGREVIAALIASARIQTKVHPRVSMHAQVFEQRLIDLICDFFERHDRIDHRGIVERGRNVRAIRRRFDIYLRRLDREGLRLALASGDTAEATGDAVTLTFHIVPASLPVRENPERIGGLDVMLELEETAPEPGDGSQYVGRD